MTIPGDVALFADDECGPHDNRPLMTAHERREADLAAGIHPTGRGLCEPAPERNAPRCCGNCQRHHRGPIAGDRGPAVSHCTAQPYGNGYRRVRLRWPGCDLWAARPPAMLDGQVAIAETGAP